MANAAPANALPRSFPGIRWVRISLRTAHLIAMGLLVGGVAAGISAETLQGAVWGTLGTGAAFVGIELYQSLSFLFQIKGLAVLVKFLLLLGAVESPGHALGLLVAAIVIGGFSSHMPGRFRHYSILHRRVLQGPSG
jgi:hypothetical protein